MKIGIKSWNEDVADFFWEVAGLLGCVFGIVGVIALGVLTIYIRHPK